MQRLAFSVVYYFARHINQDEYAAWHTIRVAWKLSLSLPLSLFFSLSLREQMASQREMKFN